ncbi:hypothetical protein WG66_008211 [Moniliophthora roreri]|nr:hypothetical protein WG66_008211 [Moniliophthora roreri]
MLLRQAGKPVWGSSSSRPMDSASAARVETRTSYISLKTIRIPSDQSHYIIELHAFHQLHCVNTI